MSNRRDVMTIGLCGLGYALMRGRSALAGPAMASSASLLTVSRAAAESVSITPPSDGLFQPMLDEHFPNLSANKSFAAMSRSAVLISNQDSRPVYAMSVTWKTSGAPAQTFRRHFVMRPSGKLHSRQLTAQVPLIGPGEVALVTPLFRWSKEVFHAKVIPANLQSARFGKYVLRFPGALVFIGSAQTAPSVTASLDAVAFADSVTGPRAASLATRLTNMRNGEHDQSLAIDQTLRGSESAEVNLAVASSLAGIAAAAAKHPVYAGSRQAFAKKVRGLLLTDFSRGQQVLDQVKSIAASTVG